MTSQNQVSENIISNSFKNVFVAHNETTYLRTFVLFSVFVKTPKKPFFIGSVTFCNLTRRKEAGLF